MPAMSSSLSICSIALRIYPDPGYPGHAAAQTESMHSSRGRKRAFVDRISRLQTMEVSRGKCSMPGSSRREIGLIRSVA